MQLNMYGTYHLRTLILVTSLTICVAVTFYALLYCTSGSDDINNQKLLTLMTSFGGDTDKTYIWNMTLQNWAHFGSDVNKVVYFEKSMGNIDEWVIRAVLNGWYVRFVNQSAHGIPILKYMLMDIEKEFDSVFYGYANSDIMFDQTLLYTLRSLENYKEALDGKLLLVGRRTNVDIELFKTSDSDISPHNTINSLVQGQRVFTVKAQDYFISFRQGFPWKRVPEFIIGRPGYDNWLVKTALSWQHNLVDATRTLHAVHQTDVTGNRAGFGHVTALEYNFDLARVDGSDFIFDGGFTSCAKLGTDHGKHGKIILAAQQPTSEWC